MHRPIPATMDDLVTQYGRLIPFVIARIVPHHLSPEDRQDIEQTVYVTLLATNYLERCRTYALAADDPGYSFTHSLRELTKNVALKFLRHRHAKMRDPLREVVLDGVVDGPLDTYAAGSAGQNKPRGGIVPASLRVEPAAEHRALQAARVERVRRHLTTNRRVIGRRPAVEVLDEALHADGSLPKYALRRMKRYVEDLHA